MEQKVFVLLVTWYHRPSGEERHRVVAIDDIDGLKKTSDKLLSVYEEQGFAVSNSDVAYDTNLPRVIMTKGDIETIIIEVFAPSEDI
nr:MAG TPA: hypothetical protein [Crassvirales sp.]